MQNCWIKAGILPPDMMAVLPNPSTDTESVDNNYVTHDGIA